MISQLATLFSLATFASFAVSAGEAAARSSASLSGDFDLANTLSRRSDDRDFRLSGRDTARFRDEKIRPQISYNPIEGGPSLELGAFGGGHKGRPKLVHVGVDWNF